MQLLQCQWSNLETVFTLTPSWWHHQMETFFALQALCVGNSPVTGEFPSQRPVTQRALMFSLICTRTNSLVNNQDTSDLRCHCAHYDITVMILTQYCVTWMILSCILGHKLVRRYKMNKSLLIGWDFSECLSWFILYKTSVVFPK